MKIQTAICIALHMCCLVAWRAVEACTDEVAAAPQQSEAPTLQSTVIMFEIVELPKSGRAEVAGIVEVLVSSSRWVPLRNGTLLGEGAKVWIAPGARLVVRFSGSSGVELRPSPFERWVIFQTDAPEQHDT